MRLLVVLPPISEATTYAHAWGTKVGTSLAARGHEIDLLYPGEPEASSGVPSEGVRRIRVGGRVELLAFMERTTSIYDRWIILRPALLSLAAGIDLPWERVLFVPCGMTSVRVEHEALRRIGEMRLACLSARHLRQARASWGRPRLERVIGWGVDVAQADPQKDRGTIGLVGDDAFTEGLGHLLGREKLGAWDRAEMAVIAGGREKELLQALGLGTVAFVPERWEEGRLVCVQAGGGLYFSTREELLTELDRLGRDRGLLRSMAVAGRRYAERYASWSAISDMVEGALKAFSPAYPLAYVIVLNWNGRKHLQTCLGSLRRQDYPTFRVMVVDNGSADGSLEFLRTHFPECEVVPLARNLGFAEGNNVGLRLALQREARYVALLNNDTEVDPHWLSGLVARAQRDERVGIVGSKMLMFDERRVLNSAGGCLNRCGFGWDDGVFTLDGPKWNEPRYCLCVTAGAMLLKREVLREIGLFDPSYFAYYEDNDLCLRAGNAGFLVAYEPSSVAYHKLSGTAREGSHWKVFLMERSRYRLVLKKYRGGVLRHLLPMLVKHDLKELRQWFDLRQYRRAAVQVRAFLHALLMLPEIRAQRVREGPIRDEVWEHVAPGLERPSFGRKGLALKSLRLMARLLPSGRILMGVNDHFLEGEWPPVAGGFPRYRPLQGTVRCRIPTSVEGPAILQLHLRGDAGCRSCVRVALQGLDLGERRVAAGWHTYTWGAGGDLDTPELTIETRGSVQLNEIVLCSPGDEVLRRR